MSSDSGRVVIVAFNKERNCFDKVRQAQHNNTLCCRAPAA